MDSSPIDVVSLDGQDIIDMTEIQHPGPLSIPTTAKTTSSFPLLPKSIEALIDATPLGVSATDIDRYNSRYEQKENSASTTWILPAHMTCQESQISAWYFLKPKPSVSRTRRIIKEWDFYGNPIFEKDQQQLPVPLSCELPNPPTRHDPHHRARRDSPPSSIFVDSSKEVCCSVCSSGCSDFLDDPKTFDDTNPSCVGEFFNCIKLNIKDLSLFCRDEAWTNRYEDTIHVGKSITAEIDVAGVIATTNEEMNTCQPLASQDVNVKDLLLEFSLRNELADLQRKEKEIEKLYQQGLLAQLEAVALNEAYSVVKQRTM